MKKRIISIIAVVLVVAMMSVVLVACAPKDLPSAEKKLEGKEFSVGAADLGIVKPVLKALGVNITGGIVGVKTVEGKEASVTALLFEDKESAEKAGDAIKENLYNPMKTRLENEKKLAKEQEDKDAIQALIDALVFKQSGNWIVFGDKSGVNALV